jgi:hypothetical protein
LNPPSRATSQFVRKPRWTLSTVWPIFQQPVLADIDQEQHLMKYAHRLFATVVMASVSALFVGGLSAQIAVDGSSAAHFDELPPSCDYLTETLAESVLQATVRPSPANEHIPAFLSQCAWSGQGVAGRAIQHTFTFDTGDQSMLIMVTGIRGPADGAGRPSEFVGSYRLAHPDMSHEQRLEFLLAEARKHLAEWSAL